MSWNLSPWGTDTPTPRRKLALLAAALGVVMMWHGLLVDFVPARWLYSPAVLAFFLIPGLAVSAALVYGNHRMGRLLGRRGLGIVIGGLLFLPIFALMTWLMFAKSLGAVVTATIGEPHAEVKEGVVVVQPWRRRRCDYFIDGGPKSDPFLRNDCVSEDYALRHEGRRVRIQRVGDRSFMGTRFTGYRHVAVLDGPPADGP